MRYSGFGTVQLNTLGKSCPGSKSQCDIWYSLLYSLWYDFTEDQDDLGRSANASPLFLKVAFTQDFEPIRPIGICIGWRYNSSEWLISLSSRILLPGRHGLLSAGRHFYLFDLFLKHIHFSYGKKWHKWPEWPLKHWHCIPIVHGGLRKIKAPHVFSCQLLSVGNMTLCKWCFVWTRVKKMWT